VERERSGTESGLNQNKVEPGSKKSDKAMPYSKGQAWTGH